MILFARLRLSEVVLLGFVVAIAAMLVILVAKGLDPAASQELWLSLLVAGGFAAAFFVFRRRVT